MGMHCKAKGARMRALIITGRYVTDCEYSYCLYRLQEEGIETHVATLDGQDTTGILGEKVKATHAIEDVNPADYKLLILPGGAKAMEYLRQSERVLNVIAYISATGGTVGSICHGAQLLISAALCGGRKISGYYSIKDDIINAGGTYVDAPFVTDGRVVTSPHYKHLGLWMKEVLRVARDV